MATITSLERDASFSLASEPRQATLRAARVAGKQPRMRRPWFLVLLLCVLALVAVKHGDDDATLTVPLGFDRGQPDGITRP